MTPERPIPLSLRAQGPLAFFPDGEGSPMSAPWPSPPQARALMERILWKPRLRYRVTALHLQRPLRYRRVPCPVDAPPLGLLAGQALYVLEDVDLVIDGQLHLNPEVARRDEADNHGKYAAMFHRRLAQGKVHEPPFFGLRAFGATLSPAGPALQPVPVDLDYGWMPGDWGVEAVQARLVQGRVDFR
jgi:CRISPR-associated protein Cas5d